MFEVKIFRGESAFENLQGYWNALYETAGEQLPFLTWEWMREWWSSFSKPEKGLSPELHIIGVFDNEICVGIAPFYVEKFLGFLRYFKMLGADANLTEVRRVLVNREMECLVYARIREYFSNECRDWSVIHWPGIPAHWELLRDMMEFEYTRDAFYVPLFTLQLASNETEFRAGLKKNIKESLRHCYNSLKKAGIEFEFRMLRGCDEVLEFLPSFYDLHSRRAQQADTVRHPNYFAAPVHRQFLENVIRKFADKAACAVIFVDGKPVASRLIFLQGEGAYLYYSGYDLDFGTFSIMTTTLMESFKYLMENGVRNAILSIGRDVSKTRWGPKESAHVEMFCCGNRWWERLLYWIFQKRRLKHMDKESLAEGFSAASRAEGVDISVVIPTYRREKDLLEAVRSVLAQTDVSLEVVIIDDSSDASARGCVESLESPLVRYIAREKNSGGKPAVVRNSVLPILGGEFVYFLDDDDLSESDSLIGMRDALRANPQVGVLVGMVSPFGNDENLVGEEKLYFAKAHQFLARVKNRFLLVPRLMFGATPLVCSSCMVRREMVLNIGGFNEDMPLCEDVDFLMRCIRRGGFLFWPRSVLRRRVYGDSLIHRELTSEKFSRSYKIMYERYRKKYGVVEFVFLLILHAIMKRIVRV